MVSAKIANGKLVLEVPLHDPRSSASGKTRVVAATGGFKETEVKIENLPVKVNITATIPRV